MLSFSSWGRWRSGIDWFGDCFENFSFGFSSPHSLKNSRWIYYSNSFAVLLLDHPPQNLAGNQRPLQIRISTVSIFRASQRLFCSNTQRNLLYFQFQVLCSEPTVSIDYTKGSHAGLSQFLGGKVTAEENQVFQQWTDSCRSRRPAHGANSLSFQFRCDP